MTLQILKPRFIQTKDQELIDIVTERSARIIISYLITHDTTYSKKIIQDTKVPLTTFYRIIKELRRHGILTTQYIPFRVVGDNAVRTRTKVTCKISDFKLIMNSKGEIFIRFKLLDEDKINHD